MIEEKSLPVMAHQVSSDHIPSINDDERIPLPPSQEETKSAVDDHVERRLSSPKTRQEDSIEGNNALQDVGSSSYYSSSSSFLPCKEVPSSATSCEASMEEDNERERLKRHRIEVAGRVWIPDIWGQEDLLKDWIDCSAFDACLVPKGIMSAREALVEEGRRATSGRLRIENRC